MLIANWFRFIGLCALPWLVACSALQYQPMRTIDHISPNDGYRLQTALKKGTDANDDEVLVVLMFSGGGTRAAAFGYGVLEGLNEQEVVINNHTGKLLDQVDLVYGISGGSVLAAYYALHGSATIPDFEHQFLQQNLQKILARQLLSASNWPRLASPQFGRGDLLQEQLDVHLFHGASYGDLLHHRQGPFAIISATDMSQGNRLDFTQEYFDVLCVDLTDMPISRAVAASSAVPLVFAPVTINNHGGRCGYRLPPDLAQANTEASDFRNKVKQDYIKRIRAYLDSDQRPFIHLLDGGLTDNLGLRSLMDATEIYSKDVLYDQFTNGTIKKVILINVNAQTQMSDDIDASANVPGLRAVLDAVVNIPIDRYSHDSLRQFHQYVDLWNQNKAADEPDLYFISINLLDLPDGALRDSVAQIPTTFYLPRHDVHNLRTAAAKLLSTSAEYRRLVRELGAKPIEVKESLPEAPSEPAQLPAQIQPQPQG